MSEIPRMANELGSSVWEVYLDGVKPVSFGMMGVEGGGFTTGGLRDTFSTFLSFYAEF